MPSKNGINLYCAVIVKARGRQDPLQDGHQRTAARLMILSRTIARQAVIAAGTRPKLVRGLGIGDDGCDPVSSGSRGARPPMIVGGLAAKSKGAWVYAALFAIYFVPMQIVLDHLCDVGGKIALVATKPSGARRPARTT